MKGAIVRRCQDLSKSHFTSKLPKIIERILVGRNIYTDEEIDFSLSALPPPKGLTDIDKAAALVADAILNKEKIIIVADYDVDGACSAVLALRVLTEMQAGNLELVMPSRTDDGYGLSEELARKAVIPKLPGLVLTVDNGIKSHSAVQLIKDAGSQVVITDHHQPGDSLPVADAIVNPNRPGCSFPATHLAGVGVCFYLFCQVRSLLIKKNYFLFQGISAPKLADFLDLVALGTVADLMPMDKTNRILTEQGLRRIRRRRTSPGILALAQQKNTAHLSTADLAFGIIPRLNAVGRLGNMELAVKCLLADKNEEAKELAKEIIALNEKRKKLAIQMKESAVNLAKKEEEQPVLCLYDENWQLGLIGPLAGSLRDMSNRPVILFARSQPGMLTGSGRSLDGLCMHSLIQQVEQICPGLLIRFGGHSRAVGLTIAAERFSEFRKICLRLTGKQQVYHSEYLSDGELTPEELSSQTANLLANFAPWGKDFPPPLFDGEFQIIGQSITPASHLKLQLRYRDYEPLLTGFKFHHGHYPLDSQHIKAAYRLATYPHSDNSLYLKIEYLQPL